MKQSGRGSKSNKSTFKVSKYLLSFIQIKTIVKVLSKMVFAYFFLKEQVFPQVKNVEKHYWGELRQLTYPADLNSEAVLLFLMLLLCSLLLS